MKSCPQLRKGTKWPPRVTSMTIIGIQQNLKIVWHISRNVYIRLTNFICKRYFCIWCMSNLKIQYFVIFEFPTVSRIHKWYIKIFATFCVLQLTITSLHVLSKFQTVSWTLQRNKTSPRRTVLLCDLFI